MIWVDRTIKDIEERFADVIAKGEHLLIRDEKTLSGRVHIGSLRGIMIHGIIAQALKEKGIEATFRFELNDFDPMDELPHYLDQETYKPYMGQPLFTVPAHEEGAENYPMVYGNELRRVVEKLHIPIEFYTLRPLYQEGKFNDVIRLALDNAEKIRVIYREVSGSQKPEDWFPLQVICEQCGKVGTTQVINWDGEKVQYVCKKNLVKWAEGCGHEGSISPFDGRAKLPWKVEWPAKWKVLNVQIEGAGKDHSAAGGSRQIGKRIAEEIFAYENPFDIPYEFFNIGGKKMSASKGRGAAAGDIAEIVPPKLLRLLMIRKLPNQPIDFDPEGATIPLLFDEYDRLADHYFKRHMDPDPEFARTYALCQVDFPAPPKDVWHMRFSLVTFLAQMPHLSALEEGEKLKGNPLTEDEKDDLEERILYAKKWLQSFAPPKYRYELSDEIPSDLSFSSEEKKILGRIAEKLKDVAWEGPLIHAALHEIKEEMSLDPKQLFQPLYRIFLSRNDGPQMGWFLSTLDRERVLRDLASLSA